MPNAMRSFDPRRVGRLECTAWVTYYRREWLSVPARRGRAHAPYVRAAVAGDAARRLARPARQPALGAVPRQRSRRRAALHGALLPPRGRPPRRDLRRRAGGRLEVEWWRVHRDVQRREVRDEEALADALAALYAHVYAVPRRRRARSPAQQRALAMRHSDRWVQEGCDRASPLVREEREALVRSYAAPPGRGPPRLQRSAAVVVRLVVGDLEVVEAHAEVAARGRAVEGEEADLRRCSAPAVVVDTVQSVPSIE